MTNLVFHLFDGDVRGTLGTACENYLLRIVTAHVIDKFRMVPYQMDGIEFASCGADAASDAAVLIHHGGPATQAPAGFRLDLLLRQGDAVVAHGLVLFGIVGDFCAGRTVETFRIQYDIVFIQRGEVSWVAG